jgi:hypothetical protein
MVSKDLDVAELEVWPPSSESSATRRHERRPSRSAASGGLVDAYEMSAVTTQDSKTRSERVGRLEQAVGVRLLDRPTPGSNIQKQRQSCDGP